MYGAGNEIRTRDLNLGKVALYQLSYSRVKGCALWGMALFVSTGRLSVRGHPAVTIRLLTRLGGVIDTSHTGFNACGLEEAGFGAISSHNQ